jgi:pyruvate/2-oxoglutarate/acetoin dehydrogenase E1 component
VAAVVTEDSLRSFLVVLDFPPDETSLLGAMRLCTLGLTPIIEIPYAKYLDCGADMFHEIVAVDEELLLADTEWDGRQIARF